MADAGLGRRGGPTGFVAEYSVGMERARPGQGGAAAGLLWSRLEEAVGAGACGCGTSSVNGESLCSVTAGILASSSPGCPINSPSWDSGTSNHRATAAREAPLATVRTAASETSSGRG